MTDREILCPRIVESLNASVERSFCLWRGLRKDSRSDWTQDETLNHSLIIELILVTFQHFKLAHGDSTHHVIYFK